MQQLPSLTSFTLFLMTLLNLVFGQSRLWKFLHGLVAVPVETVFTCMIVTLVGLTFYVISLYKPVSLRLKFCVA